MILLGFCVLLLGVAIGITVSALYHAGHLPDWASKALLVAAGVGLLLSLSACATRQNVLELGAGFDDELHAGRNPQSVIRYRNEPRGAGNGWVFEYDHHSSFADGKPFNDNPEDTTDQFSVIYRWVF